MRLFFYLNKKLMKYWGIFACFFLSNVKNELNIGKYMQNFAKKIKLIKYWRILANICGNLQKIGKNCKEN